MKKSFSERLEHLRGDRSQREFAKKIGVPLTSYTNWVLGVSQPKFDNLVSICSTLGVSADWLLGLPGASAPAVPSVPSVPSVPPDAASALRGLLARPRGQPAGDHRRSDAALGASKPTVPAARDGGRAATKTA
jgi:transcriptional regulator with XRE-family HTH domain